jgi:hypothetical protein
LPEETVVIDLDSAVPMAPLVYLDEGDQVTVGRPDIDSYAVLPVEGAELVRRLAEGMTPRDAARWFADTFGDEIDIEELLADLSELALVGVLPTTAVAPVRLQRLGSAVFSRAALLGYALIVLAAVLAAVRDSALRPGYPHLFFTPYFAVVELVLFLGQFPLMLLHEAAHVLAGRRLGLRTRVSLGFRFYYFVLETSMDGLVSVPARRRVLPMVAGIGADLVTASLLTLLAAAVHGPGGEPLIGRLALALAFATLLRIAWQFYFFLRTDLYYLVSLVLGCVDLHGTAMGLLRNVLARLRRRPDLATDESTWHPNDVRAGRWYAALVVLGYGFSLVLLVVAVAPTAYHFLTGVFGHLTGSAGAGGVLDAVMFLGLNLIQLTVVAVLAVRAYRVRRALTR